jgi:hypothetical protein
MQHTAQTLVTEVRPLVHRGVGVRDLICDACLHGKHTGFCQDEKCPCVHKKLTEPCTSN